MSSKSREEDEIPNLKDLPWTTSCRRGLTPPPQGYSWLWQPGNHLHLGEGPPCREQTVPDSCVMSSVVRHRQGAWSLRTQVLCAHAAWE